MTFTHFDSFSRILRLISLIFTHFHLFFAEFLQFARQETVALRHTVFNSYIEKGGTYFETHSGIETHSGKHPDTLKNFFHLFLLFHTLNGGRRPTSYEIQPFKSSKSHQIMISSIFIKSWFNAFSSFHRRPKADFVWNFSWFSTGLITVIFDGIFQLFPQV